MRVDIGRVPRRHDQPAANRRLRLIIVDHLRDLVDAAAVGGRPGPPLRAIDRAEVAVGIGPLVPDRDAVVLQVLDVGVAGAETTAARGRSSFRWQLLGGHQRKAVGQVEPHLMAEHRQRAGAGAVMFFRALVQDAGQQIEILLHVV
ncbi:MAG: hypothetical protein MZV49_08415 [Rhodopseudomonas palustris]|nr:hypothetical protein [Rhodopseudomonas palustris]